MEFLTLIAIFTIIIGYLLLREFKFQDIIYISDSANDVNVFDNIIGTRIALRNRSKRIIKSANLTVTAFDDMENQVGEVKFSFYKPEGLSSDSEVCEVYFGHMFSDAVKEGRLIKYKIWAKKILFADGKIRKSLNI